MKLFCTNKAIFSRHLKEAGIDKQRNFEGANTGLLQDSESKLLIFSTIALRVRVYEFPDDLGGTQPAEEQKTANVSKEVYRGSRRLQE